MRRLTGLPVRTVGAFTPLRADLNPSAGAKTKADRLRLVEDLLQYCIQPRARMSLPDATFAYQIVKRLHSMNTPNFHTILFFNRVRPLPRSSLVCVCTDLPASETAAEQSNQPHIVLLHGERSPQLRYEHLHKVSPGPSRSQDLRAGLFLHDALADLCRWYKDAALYDTDVIGAQLEGFKRTLGKSSDEARTHYDHAEFQAALLKWQEAMTQVSNGGAAAFR